MLEEIRKILDIKPKEKKQGFIEKISTIQKQKKRINTLELELETLKNTIKEDLYKEFMIKLREPTQNDRLKRENKRLREQNKSLKDIIRGD